MSFSVLDYYVFIRHKKSMNFIYAFYHLLICLIRYTIILFSFALHSLISIPSSLSNVCGYVLEIAVRFLGIDYLVIDDGIHCGICNDL